MIPFRRFDLNTLRAAVLLILMCVISAPSKGQVSIFEYAARRAALATAVPDGLIAIKARSAEKDMEQWGWIQNASFLYFTGLANQPGAILVLNPAADESILFVPPDPLSFGLPVAGLSVAPGAESAANQRLSGVRSWSDFPAYITKNLGSNGNRLYIEKPRRAESDSVPMSMLSVSGEFGLWESSVRNAFPGADVLGLSDVISRMRWKKSDAEIEILRENALITASALKSGIHSIRSGITQRDAEAAVVAGCVAAGGEGPSFWPWMMSGPNTNFTALIGSFFDYSSLNRTMLDGELVRADVGCASRLYGGDVGRTLPVSGRFSKEQETIWNLLVTGYRAGLKAMKDGILIADVRTASAAAIRSAGLASPAPEVQDIATAMTAETGSVDWHLHGVGIESGEEAVETLVSGAVIAYEPMFSWNDQSYYLEDMILVHSDHAEILSTGLPYTADEIEAFMTENYGHKSRPYPLFNGRDLSGWVNYGTEKWYVENGELVCESGPESAYGYLGTDEVFQDFELTLEFLQESNGNSGVFFRSWVLGTTVEGWQVEVAPPMAHTGGIYESYGRGWLIQPDEAGERALREGEWNTLRIRAIGDHVTTWLNGQQMVDLRDEKIGAAKGRIALQIHDGGGIKVRWKNIIVQRL